MVMVVGENVPNMGRRMRRPKHSFQLRTQPFQIVPFVIAPVLAGETLKNALLQARVVTDPIKNPLIGWWKEYYLFYVKLTDYDFYYSQINAYPGGDVGPRVKMLLADPTFDKTAWDFGADSIPYMGAALGQNYAAICNGLVIDNYFRDENDVGVTYQIGSGAGQTYPIAKVTQDNWLDSALLSDNYVRPDYDLDNADGVLMVSEVDDALRRYQWMRANGLTDASYEDYLATFGISTAPAKPHKPELLRYVRQWQYPSNTVEPTTGVPSSAVSWSIQERADKDRFFNEPGFVFGVTVTRPKVYFSNMKYHAAQFLDRAEDWLPNALAGKGDAHAFMKKFANTGGILGSTVTDADGYWIDVRDLFLYGDQWVNFALTATDAGMVALPTATLQKKYPSAADVDALFVTPLTKNLVREDGIIDLTIAGSQRDLTATT